MPTTVPSSVTSGPPELPPWMDTSSWRTRRPVPDSVSRRLTLPVVTVASSVRKEARAFTALSATLG